MLFLIILILAVLIQFINLWWIIVPLAFIAALFWGKSGGQSFWSGFAANALVWALWAIIKIVPANNILLSKVSAMLFLPHWSLLLVLTLLIGGLISGVGALAGYYTKQLMPQRPLVKAG
jgi:sensor histidine kinase YesM